MKLTTRGRYGVRLMLDLALYSKDAPVSLKDIALRQKLPPKYLWQLIYLLKKSGFIIASRGARAGYSLARNPGQINLKDIVSVLEGRISLVECVDNPSFCKQARSCVPRQVWKEATDKINNVLSSFTLKKMMKQHILMNGNIKN